MDRELPNDISFDQWVEYVFDHPVLDHQWWFHLDDSEYYQHWDEDADGALTLTYMADLFRNPAFLMKHYDRPQIDQGLNFLVSNSCSNHMLLLRDETVPWPLRQSCIHAMSNLYAELMAPVYGDDLAHSRDGPGDPERPNDACYMWWDAIPLYGGLRHSGITEAVFRVFDETLNLRSEACLESVLHGLGHWHLYYPERAGEMVRRFLAVRQEVSEQLRAYARQAAVGGVQ